MLTIYSPPDVIATIDATVVTPATAEVAGDGRDPHQIIVAAVDLVATKVLAAEMSTHILPAEAIVIESARTDTLEDGIAEEGTVAVIGNGTGTEVAEAGVTTTMGDASAAGSALIGMLSTIAGVVEDAVVAIGTPTERRKGNAVAVHRRPPRSANPLPT